MKRSPLKRTVIRQLRPGESPPDDEPRRYADPRGYTRLRWKIGQREYVETYERNNDGSMVREGESRQKRVDVERASRLYQQGMTQPEIAAELGCDPAAVSRVLRRNGVKTRNATDYAAVLNEDDVVTAYQSGIGTPALARQFGVSRDRIGAALRKAGVMRRVGTPNKEFGRDTFETEFQKARPLVLARCGNTCEAGLPGCRHAATHVHHRKLRSQGGDNSLVNLLGLCMSCHGRIHGSPARSYSAGFLVRSWNDPGLVPVAAHSWD